MPYNENTVAFNASDFQLDPVAQRFFDNPSPQALNDVEPPVPMSRAERGAMRATFAMLGLFAVAMTGFLIYARVIMPTPAELVGDSGQTEISR